MASFLEDIYKLTGGKTSVQETHKKEILQRLCDPSASLTSWEDAALSFLMTEKLQLWFKLRGIDGREIDFRNFIKFEHYLDDSFENLVKLLPGYVKTLSELNKPVLSLNPSCCGDLLSTLTGSLDCLRKLRDKIALLAVVKAHYQARKLRNISGYVQKNTQQEIAGSVSELTRATDDVDQSLLMICNGRSTASRLEFKGIQTVLHDSIYETAHRCAILPSRLHMHEVDTMPKAHVNGGGFADIYKGTLRDGQVIALKVPRCFGKPDEIKKVDAEISKEGIVWHFSSHENVLPLLGISRMKFQGEKPDSLVLVTPWMANGTLREFLRSNPHTNRAQMIRGVASGVYFLHTLRVPPVVHGDLRCDNILVDKDGVPKIADFGLSRVKDFQASLTGTSSAGARGSLRWQAPELLFPETFGGTGKHTFASDIYALGMTCLEIVTDEVPYSGFIDAQVIAAVLHGNLPKVSDNVVYQQLPCTERQWKMVKCCWSRNTEDRPSASDLRSAFEALSSYFRSSLKRRKSHAAPQPLGDLTKALQGLTIEL